LFGKEIKIFKNGVCNPAIHRHGIGDDGRINCPLKSISPEHKKVSRRIGNKPGRQSGTFMIIPVNCCIFFDKALLPAEGV
jgi:hypothetical protein